MSDGAGSASHSEIGAELIIKTATNYIFEFFHQLYHKQASIATAQIVKVIQNALDKKASELSLNINDLLGTLLFVAVDQNVYLAGHIGDGLLGLLNKDVVGVLSGPAHGEYLNSTFFVNQLDAARHLRLYKGTLENIEGFVVMSDGSANSLYSKQKKLFAPAVRQMFYWFDKYPVDEVESVLTYNLNHLIKTKTGDDCSVGLMRRLEL